tara:strand:+ start:680 stop:1027 length:348 start_codon:yes stop_codon:yes gene_type:complete
LGLAVKRKTKNYNSILNNIKNNYKNKSFEFIINNLTLEELISAKLELSSKGLNGKLYGYPIFKNINQITKEALVRFSLRYSNSQKKAAALLGLSLSEFKSYIKKYNLNIGENDEY